MATVLVGNPWMWARITGSQNDQSMFGNVQTREMGVA